MSYEVIGSSLAERKLDKLPKPDRDRIYAKFAILEENPRPPNCIKLTGHGHQGWRIRAGNYRIIYQIDDDADVVRILDIEWRDKAYKDRG